MIYKIRLLFVLMILSSIHANAQRRSGERNIALKNNVFGYLIDTYNFSLEYQIESKQSVQLVIKLFNREEFHSKLKNMGSGNYDKEYSNGFSLGGEYRTYLGKRANDLRGVYVSPYLRVFFQDKKIEPGYYTIEENQGHVNPLYFKRTIFSGGLILGVQGIGRDSGIGVDLFIGAGFRQFKDRSFKGMMSLYEKQSNTRPELRFGLNLLISNA